MKQIPLRSNETSNEFPSGFQKVNSKFTTSFEQKGSAEFGPDLVGIMDHFYKHSESNRKSYKEVDVARRLKLQTVLPLHKKGPVWSHILLANLVFEQLPEILKWMQNLKPVKLF